jgi:serine/threonine-protein phosphatase 2A regulatory subunit B
MESRPIKVIPVHDFLRSKLSELYETDCIFDKFEVSTAGRDGTSIMTGSYSNCFKIYDTVLGSETTIELAKGKPKQPAMRPIVGGFGLPGGGDGEVVMAEAGAALDSGRVTPPPRPLLHYDDLPPIEVEDVDFGKKVLHFSWHPHDDIIAVAGLNNLYIYHA